MGEEARAVIDQALQQLGIKTITNINIQQVDANGVTLDNGQRLDAATVVWSAGMRANPLISQLGLETDWLGGLPVNKYLQVNGLENVFAAGDAAQAVFSDGESVMSCQNSRPMGRFAGYNAIAHLLGQAMKPLDINWYVTVLDLGAAGAVYTQGRDRKVIATGEQAKRTKQTINGQRIYPPLNENAEDILAAAEPSVDQPPATSTSRG